MPYATGRVRLAGKDAVAAGTDVVPLFAVAAQAIVDTLTHLYQAQEDYLLVP